ncbi:LysR family transcriptional regulator (plasmid) [Deinococcus aetherius]|uniref:LysR family transcriptional regulator n=1 Tax=Deinococcus aetherius TaxID=200252 RepID=A0ABN6RMU0_9DEIO|nr:LysR family transcriptional regulator [Deinococcus aetherius]BDP43656.1 LysR family transcriptional regulator [Deinococcus aetherius]
MDLDQLLAFDRIVREGSFVRAAWSLGVVQPTVSARIQALEREVGGRLFVRGRKVTLTERGVSFLPYARRALSTLQDGVEAARLASAGERGRLAVGALRSLSGYFLAPALVRYYARSPDVECLVREGRQAEVVEQLCDGVVELGLMCWPPLDPLLADMTPLLHLREEVVLVVPRDHPLAGQGEVTQAELLAQSRPLLLLRWWPATPPELAALVTRAPSVADVPMDTGRFLLARGVGTGFFPRMVIAADLAEGRVAELRVVDLPPLHRDSALVHLSRQPGLSSAALNFAEVVREEARGVGLLSEAG